MRSINGNTGWSDRDLQLEVILVTGLNIGVRGQGGSDVGLGEVASSILSGVGVEALGVDTLVIDDVLHGLGHETSIAALVSVRVRAVHDVLLGEGDEGLLGQEVASFS